MNSKEELDGMHLQATAKDTEQIFVCPTEPDKITSFEFISDSDVDQLEYLFLQSVRNNPDYTLCNELRRNWSIIESLGAFLGIDDYKTDLYSCWILRTLTQQIIDVSKIIDEIDYKNVIYWILEAIDVIKDNPNMTRKKFFILMNKMFHHILHEILSGQDLSFPFQLMHLYLEKEEREEESSEDFSEINMFPIENDELFDTEMQSDIGETENRKQYLETLLHVIVDVVYEIFGSETDYMLIQSTLKNRDNVINYTIPYHYRKPKIVKKSEPKRKISAASTLKTDKKKKKKDAIKKETTEGMPGIFLPIPISSTSSIDQSKFMLPLSEAIESYDAIHSTENKNEKTENINE